MDPNWFYSTLAQSTAAIVGLMGGFLAQQLLAQRREVAELREAVRNRASHHFTSVVQPTRNAAQQVLNSLTEVKGRVEQAQSAGPAIATLPADVHVAVLTPPPQSTVTATQGLTEPLSGGDLPALDRAIDVATALRDSLVNDFSVYAERLRTEAGIGQPEAEFLKKTAWTHHAKPQPGPGFKMWLALQEDVAAELWWKASEESKPIVGHLQNFRARLVPPSFYWLLAILGALLIVGVSAPLFFLTARSDASRELLLVAFVPLALALLAFFMFELRRLRRADRLGPDTF